MDRKPFGPIAWTLSYPRAVLLAVGLVLTLAPPAFIVVRRLVGQMHQQTDGIPAIVMGGFGLVPSTPVRLVFLATFLISMLAGIGMLLAAGGLTIRQWLEARKRSRGAATP